MGLLCHTSTQSISFIPTKGETSAVNYSHPSNYIESNNDCKTLQQFSFIMLFSLLGIAFSSYRDGWHYPENGGWKHPSLLSRVDAVPLANRGCFLYIRCYDEFLHAHSYTGVTGMSVLDSSQCLLTPQQPLFRQQRMKCIRSEPSLSNKALWCGDVTSWQVVTVFDVVSLQGDEGARRYPTGVDVGRKRPREERELLISAEAGGCCGQSQCGCSVYQTHFLPRLLQRGEQLLT